MMKILIYLLSNIINSSIYHQRDGSSNFGVYLQCFQIAKSQYLGVVGEVVGPGGEVQGR